MIKTIKYYTSSYKVTKSDSFVSFELKPNTIDLNDITTIIKVFKDFFNLKCLFVDNILIVEFNNLVDVEYVVDVFENYPLEI